MAKEESRGCKILSEAEIMGFSFLKYHNSKRSQIKRGVWKRGIAIALFATPRLSPPNCWGIWVSLGQLPVQAWGLQGLYWENGKEHINYYIIVGCILGLYNSV